MAATLEPIRITANPTLSLAKPAFRVAILLVTDTVTFSLSVACAFWYWSIVNPGIPRHHSAMYLAVGFGITAFAYHGLYPGIGFNAVQQMRLMFRSTMSVYLILAATMVLARDQWANSRGGFFLSWLLALILAPSGRWLVNYIFNSRAWWKTPVIILGAGNTASAVIRNIKENRVLGYHPVLCLDDDLEKHGKACAGVPVLGPLSEAETLAALNNIRCVIVAMPTMPRIDLITRMRHWVQVFPRILIIPDLLDVGSLWIEPHDLGGVLSLELQHHLLNPFNRFVKRTTDVLIAGVACILAGPLILFAAIWIKAVSPGSAFYRQKREGRDGETINVLKLRTMYPDAEHMLQRHLDDNPAARAEWDEYCKLRNDPRILPGVGHFLRRTSLDELPQLFNILSGEMSLVGPRPFPSYHNERFDPDFRNLRMQVTPGLTGLWQIKARSNGNLDVQAALDTYYVRNWSLWLDIYILIRTVREVLNSHGAY